MPRLTDYEHRPGDGTVELQAEADARVDLAAERWIGAGEVPPFCVECRMGADIFGELRWLWRASETGDAWIEADADASVGWTELRAQLLEVFPLHVAVWFEESGEFAWMDA